MLLIYAGLRLSQSQPRMVALLWGGRGLPPGAYWSYQSDWSCLSYSARRGAAETIAICP